MVENGTAEVAAPEADSARHALPDPAATALVLPTSTPLLPTSTPPDARPEPDAAPADSAAAADLPPATSAIPTGDTTDADDAAPAWEAATAAVPLGSVPADSSGRSDPITRPLPAGSLDVDPPAPDAAQRIRYVSGAASVSARPAADNNTTAWAGPTLFETVNPAGATPYQAPPGATTHRPRRRGWWIAAVIVVVVLIGGGLVAYTQLRSTPASPSSAVRQYFSDLSSGDTTAAMLLVDNGTTYPPTTYPLLNPTALAQAANRPAHLAVGTSTPTTLGDGRMATAISVTYSAGGTTVHQRISVVTTKSGSTQPFLLEAPFVKLAVSAAGGRSVTINGIAYSADAAHSLAFPGAYVATVAGSSLVSSGAANVVFDDSKPGSVTATAALPAATIAPNAAAAVQSAVNAALDSCASSSSASPKNCPFSYHDSSAKMTWSIQSYPTVQVGIGGDGGVTFDSGSHSGSVNYEAKTSSWFFGFPQTDRGDQDLHVTGTATANGSNVSVKFAS